MTEAELLDTGNCGYEWKQRKGYTKNIFESEQLFCTTPFIRHIFSVTFVILLTFFYEPNMTN